MYSVLLHRLILSLDVLISGWSLKVLIVTKCSLPASPTILQTHEDSAFRSVQFNVILIEVVGEPR